MTRLRPLTRRLLLGLVVATTPLAPGCSCGVLAALAALNTPPETPLVAPLPAITRVAALPVSGDAVPLTSVSAQVVGVGTTELRPLEDAETFAGRVTLVEGSNTIFVAATNGAAVTSEPAGPFVVVLDTIAPQAPNVIEPDAPLAAGVVPFETTLTVEAGADCLLDLSVDGTPVDATDVVADEGGFVVSVTLDEGPNAIEASCRDLAGNRSAADLATIEVVLDTTLPAPPLVDAVETPLVFDAPATTARLTLRGTRVEGTQLVVDGALEVQAAPSAWVVTRDLAEADHELELQTQGGNGNRSEVVTVAVPVRLRPEPPIPAPPPAVTNATTLTITGTRCVAGHKVYATTSVDAAGDAALAGTCAADRFTTAVRLVAGRNDIYLYTERDLGVQSRRVGPISVTLDTEPPPPPQISFPSCAATAPRNCNAIIGAGETSGIFELSGTRDSADTITVNGTEVAAGDALWNAAVPVAATGTTTVTVRAVDPAGNLSDPVVVTVVAVAGLTSPTLQCLGPYRFSGTSSACPIPATSLPASRRAVRGDDIVVRGRVATAGHLVRVCSVPASLGALEDPCDAAAGAQVVEVVPLGDRTFVAPLENSVSTGGINVFLQAHTADANGQVSAFVGPNFIRRDTEAPAAPSSLVVADTSGPLAGVPRATDELDVVLSGVKAFDGDVCLRQVTVTEQTCPAGACPPEAFSTCLVLTGADGLTTWRGDVRLLGGLNRLCVESSDVVPLDGEVANPNVAAGERQFVGNVSAEVCVDVQVSVDPGPEFLQPVAASLVPAGPLVVRVALQDPADLATGVNICVDDTLPCAAASENVADGVWTATVQVPDGNLGDSIVLTAQALIGAEVRGATSITVHLVPSGQLVSDTGVIVAGEMLGRVAPTVAGGIGGELLTAWEDDCFARGSPVCTVRNTAGVLQNSPPPSVFLRRMVADGWQRIVNVSDDPRVGASSTPVITVDNAGVTHIAWIDDGFDDPQGTLVHRTLDPDLATLRFSPTVVVSADFENANGLKELDFGPAMASGVGGETVVAWVKQRDAVEGSQGTRYIAFAAYCTAECTGYESEVVRAAGVWSAAVQISPTGNTPLEAPSVALDAEALPNRRAWVAWNLLTPGGRVLQLRDVPLDPAAAIPVTPPLTIASTRLSATSKPLLAMDPSGLLHVAWTNNDGVQFVTVDTTVDPPTFSAVRQLVAHDATATASTADIVAPTAGRATVVVSMLSTEDFCFADPPDAGTLRIVEVGSAIEVSSLLSGGLTQAPRVATLAGGSTAIVYEADACAANGEPASNAFLEVVSLP